MLVYGLASVIVWGPAHIGYELYSVRKRRLEYEAANPDWREQLDYIEKQRGTNQRLPPGGALFLLLLIGVNFATLLQSVLRCLRCGDRDRIACCVSLLCF